MRGEGEFGLIARLAERLRGTVRSPSPDCGARRARETTRRSPRHSGVTVTSTEALVEGVHFRREWSPPPSIGRKALAAALSDLAAMGSEPGRGLRGAGDTGGLRRGRVPGALRRHRRDGGGHRHGRSRRRPHARARAAARGDRGRTRLLAGGGRRSRWRVPGRGRGRHRGARRGRGGPAAARASRASPVARRGRGGRARTAPARARAADRRGLGARHRRGLRR